jgi:hypothetical protein
MILPIGETRNAYTLFIGKSERKRSLGKRTCRLKVILKWDLKRYGRKMWSEFL